jgi:hypothetical protein
MHPGQIFIQVNAPGHAYKSTIMDLIKQGIQ